MRYLVCMLFFQGMYIRSSDLHLLHMAFLVLCMLALNLLLDSHLDGKFQFQMVDKCNIFEAIQCGTPEDGVVQRWRPYYLEI